MERYDEMSDDKYLQEVERVMAVWVSADEAKAQVEQLRHPALSAKGHNNDPRSVAQWLYRTVVARQLAQPPDMQQTPGERQGWVPPDGNGTGS